MKYINCTLKIITNISASLFRACALCGLILSFSYATSAIAEEAETAEITAGSNGVSLLADIENLDRRFKQLSTSIYTDASKNLTLKSLKFSEIEELRKSVQLAVSQDNQFSAISKIHLNIPLIEENISEPAIAEFIEVLLKQNEFNTADQIFQFIKDDGDEFLIAQTSLIFAEYYNRRGDWKQVIQLLNIELGELSSEAFNRVNLLTGIALQHLRFHRKAVRIYQQIPSSSIDYPLAQLNIAVAHIRQDWWTDAHIIIKQLLNNQQVLKDPELEDRLYLMLGYSLLSKEFLREAREAFRNVSVKSVHTNKAIMGIALTAISQNDYSSAVNALQILKKKSIKSLVSEEAYLLLPSVYRMLEKFETADSGYVDAINYFQIRSVQLGRNTTSDKFYNLDNISISKNSDFVIENSPLNINQHYPSYLIGNYNKLKNLVKQTSNSQLKIQAEKLLHDYAVRIDRVVKALLQNRIKQLDSYLSQSRYNLAKLYDHKDE